MTEEEAICRLLYRAIIAIENDPSIMSDQEILSLIWLIAHYIASMGYANMMLDEIPDVLKSILGDRSTRALLVHYLESHVYYSLDVIAKLVNIQYEEILKALNS